eukprot:3423783-Rhodomonas_salina.2
MARWIETSTVACSMVLLSMLAGAEAFAKPAKLSRVSIDVCPFNSLYAEVSHKIHQLEEENASLARHLEAHCLGHIEYLEKSGVLGTSSVSDAEEEYVDRGSTPLRLRGGNKADPEQVPVN